MRTRQTIAPVRTTGGPSPAGGLLTAPRSTESKATDPDRGHRLGAYSIQPPPSAAVPAIQRHVDPIQLGRDETKGKKAKARALARRKQQDIKAFKTGKIGNRANTDHIKRPSGVATRAQEEDAVLPIFNN